MGLAHAHRHAGLAGGLVEARHDLRRHVVLVVLGQYLVGLEHALPVQPAVHDDALPLAEQVGQDADVLHRQAVGTVSDREAHPQATGFALDAAGLDQPADAKARARRHLACGHLGGVVEIQQVFLEGAEHQRCRAGQPDCQQSQQQHAFPPPGHGAAFRARISSRISRRSRRSRSNGAMTFHSNTTKVMP
jgi:hypothetical protein